MRVHVAKYGDRGHLIVLVMHHLISDAWSIGILLRDLASYYSDIRRYGDATPREDLGRFALFSRNELAGSENETEEESHFWRRYLHGAPERSSFRMLGLRGGTSGAGRLPFEIALPVLQSLERVARARRVTLFTLLATNFATLLARFLGVDDLVFGTSVFNRSESSLKDVVGPFLNVLPIRVEYSAERPALDAVSDMRQNIESVLRHQYFPFDRIVRAVEPKAHSRGTSCFSEPAELPVGQLRPK